MKELFWNPAITRVVVLGPQRAPDGLPFTGGRLTSAGFLVGSNGARIAGPFVLGPDTSALGERPDRAVPFTILAAMPKGVAFGWYKDGYVAVVGRIFASSGGAQSAVALRLHSLDGGRKTLALRCDSGVRRDLVFGPAGRRAAVSITPRSVRACWFGLTRGTPEHVGRFNFSGSGEITLDQGR
jgi:hypothetical protein